MGTCTTAVGEDGKQCVITIGWLLYVPEFLPEGGELAGHYISLGPFRGVIRT